MGTRKVVIAGTGYWMKLFEQNRDLTGFNDALKDIGGQCVMDIDLSKEEFAKLKKANFMSSGKPSPDNPGCTRVKLKRKWTEDYGGGAPLVLKSDNSVWNYEVDGPIGNGSTVAAVVYVYDTKAKGIYGARLDKVKVLNHVPYIKDEFGDLGVEEEEDPAPKHTEPKPAAKSKKEVLTADIEDDEVPF